MLLTFTKNHLPKKAFFLSQGILLHIARLLFLFLFIFAAAFSSFADCACDYTVPSGQHVTDGKALGLKPGDVICLKAGNHYGNLKFVNIIGSASQPIIIKNCGGQVTISADASFSLKTENSKHFRITGSGSADRYGIVLKNATLGLSLDILSTDFEVERLEIHHIGFAGIMAKTDPKCGKPYGRSEFTMQNISIHDNYIHDTQGEGIYVGNSAYAKGVKQSCGTLLPHAVLNAKVYHNKVERTGWDGIQIGSATQGCEVYGNQVEAYGKRSNSTHGNGIQLGEGTGGKCYNNIIKEGYENGIIVLGKGDNVVFNNLIINTGAHGCFIDARAPATTGSGFKFFNNTIISPGKDGVRIYATQSGLHNQVKNNLVVGGSEAVALLHAGVTNTTVSNNYRADLVADVGFVNAGSGDYRLTSKSPCIDKGADLTSYGVTFGLAGSSRPKGNALDQGAYEYNGSSSSSNKSPTVNAGSDKTITLPTNSVKLTAGASDPDGSIVSYIWTKKTGPSATLNNTKAKDLTASQLIKGTYVFSVTVKDNKGASSSDEVQVIVRDSNSQPAPAPSPPSGNNGLTYSYYEGSWSKLPNFSKLSSKKRGTVSNFSLSPRTRNENFGFVFEGYIDIKTSGTYTFYTASDDGSALYINDNRIVNNDGLHPVVERSGSKYLSKGKHAIKVIFFDRTGEERLEVKYAGPGLSKRSIPSSVLSTKNNGTAAASDPPPSSNTVIAYAGSDITVSSPSSQAKLSGRGKGPYSFRSYQWMKVSGPSVSMKDQNTANVKLSGLKVGTYVFRFTAIDNKGNKGSDEMILRVNGNARVASTSKASKQWQVSLEDISYQTNTYPNPVQDQLNVAIDGAQGEILTLQMVDITGRTVFQREAHIRQNKENVTLDVNQHITAPGLFYLIIARPSGEQNTLKLLKK